MQKLGGAPALILLFAIAHALLIQLGYALKGSPADPSVMWPAAGLVLATLWLTPRWLWPAILATQFVVEVLIAALMMTRFRPGLVVLYTVANMAGPLVGALLASWQIKHRVFLRAREVIWFVLVTAISAMVSALIAAPVHAAALGGGIPGSKLLVIWQVWAAGQWAGIMAVAPLMAFWLNPLRMSHPELRLRSRTELLLLALVLFGACFYVSQTPGRAETLLQLPTTIALLMILAVMRLPPRWVAVLFAMTAVTLASFAAHDLGPLREGTALIGIGRVQVFIVSVGLSSFALSMTMAERVITARRLADSEDRYRSFFELSTEAMWRVELSRPMSVWLPPAQQIAWLRAYACVAEFSRSYEPLDPQAAAAHNPPLSWRPELPWAAALEQQIEHAAQQGFVLDGLRFQVPASGRTHAYVASIDGVVRDGMLHRMWLVARDITELTELNSNLLRERERLKSFARQIVSAEEKARRATAVDLHDGIGQSLAGMAMTLDVARQHSGPEVRLMIEEVNARLREVQERTRNMISDLSPPGLYELGLEAALQWLVVYVRGHDKLQVELDADLREDAVPLETRVLVFKLVRELLRNVSKHSGVRKARVMVRGDAQYLHVEVSDRGRGFEWQLDMFGSRSGGFGLWSIADRVHEAGAQLTVDTSPGRGARFEIRFPLRQGARSEERNRGALRSRG